MKWSELDIGWRAAFGAAWDSFLHMSTPVGAALQDETGKLLAVGRNRIFDMLGEEGQVSGHRLAHAEINALLKIDYRSAPKVARYTLTCTTEPCPMCYGAIMICGVRNVRFAVRDRIAGSAEFNELDAFINSQQIKVQGPVAEVAPFQVALQYYHKLERGQVGDPTQLRRWEEDCPSGAFAAMELLNEGALGALRERSASAAEVYDIIAMKVNGS